MLTEIRANILLGDSVSYANDPNYARVWGNSQYRWGLQMGIAIRASQAANPNVQLVEVNWARGGTRVEDGLKVMDSLPTKPLNLRANLFIGFGVNDFSRGDSAQFFYDQMTRITDKAISKGYKPSELYISNLSYIPQRMVTDQARWDAYQWVCSAIAQRAMTFAGGVGHANIVDQFSSTRNFQRYDGVHPDAYGNASIATFITDRYAKQLTN
jgi:lysophospholipase L1-like esterase